LLRESEIAAPTNRARDERVRRNGMLLVEGLVPG
jgi:hypothetical protein